MSIDNIISPIPESIVYPDYTTRYSGASWFEEAKNKRITIAGLGGIGRFGNLNNIYYLCA